MLVFFPSYTMMDRVMDRWKNTTLYDQIQAIKVCTLLTLSALVPAFIFLPSSQFSLIRLQWSLLFVSFLFFVLFFASFLPFFFLVTFISFVHFCPSGCVSFRLLVFALSFFLFFLPFFCHALFLHFFHPFVPSTSGCVSRAQIC